MRDGRQTEDMFVSEADRAPSSTAEKSRMVDRMENTMSCWQANCYDDLADVDRLDCCLGRKAH